ncbi:WhiB family transcriptional regulator [Streptomyces sp. TLI_171]|uniref:WhiB family transcriptional regulator n=1 Tax=Streptomyces sp. TLI_171 TaxID=1938859 RepID=UPI000C1781CB|nr:WhiB family transcriptional regulator [Streptomyces sp. TLI_171]RKE19616.1 WhiB family redox-sensing transcriptional regulator [Streptomyces sp. TLI_171]
MTRIVRRGLRGTARPHLSANPIASPAALVPSPDGDLHGAACQGMNPDLFYAAHDPDESELDPQWVEFATRRAKAVCAGCPVREMCLALALRRSEPHGVFGGLTAEERRQLKRRTGRKAVAA